MIDGRIIVLSAPSGSGKGTVISRLLTINHSVSPSVSYTSREARRGEREGVHYYFVSKDKFQKMVANGEFVEWDQYQGDFYGTSRQKINEILQKGGEIVFDITIKGAYAIRENFPLSALVFLLPPSFSELERRLRGRGTESDEKIAGRLAEARHEITALKNFDYCIVNDDATEAAKRLDSIISAEKSRVRANEVGSIIKNIQEAKII